MRDESLLRQQKSIIVDAGHGGADPGAVNGNLLEKDFNLRTSKYMYDRFRQLGIPVAITRDDDTTLTRQERIDAMTKIFGNSPDVIILSNHINAGGGEGAEVVYALRSNDTLAKNILNEIGNAGQITRSYYQRRLPSDPSKDYYYIQRETGNTTPLLIEYGFIDNDNDIYKLQNNILDYAEGVVKAVTNYIGVPYVSPIIDEDNMYVVQKGDSLYSIAMKYGVTIDEIKAANALTSNILQVGQRLVIPMTTPDVIGPTDYLVYTVEKGDSLWSIANKYDTTVMDLVQLNQLGSSTLSIGQQLLIPSQETVGEENVYIVEKGDSLWSIANKYNVNVADLISINNLEDNILQIGDELLIPNGEEIVEEDPVDDKVIEYIVQKNDNLWNIANKYNTTVNELKSINNLNSNILQPGQQLLIPNTEAYLTYYVKKDDNLWNIARDYDTSVDNIKKLNNLISDDLKIGQVLILPN